MKWTNYHGLLAVACLLLTSSLVQGTHIERRLGATPTKGPSLLPRHTRVPSIRARQTVSNPPAASSTASSTASVGGGGALAVGAAPLGGFPAAGPIKVDAINFGFIGGNPPDTTIDLPVTIVFLLLFAAGALTHISIYRSNAKRGHKFLLSDLLFDFCLMRGLACALRIAWIFFQTREVILAAQILFNGGAAVIFAVNTFLVQRIVRSMHPKIGWSNAFSFITLGLAISVPIMVVVQISALVGLFVFSIDNVDRLLTFSSILKFGASYNMFMASFPFVVVATACAIPGPRPEKFGEGHLRVKTSMVMFASVLLSTGAVVRIYASFNRQLPNTTDVLFSKTIFYSTQFFCELAVAAMYALLRFDLLFHVPNGSSGPGDYSRGRRTDLENGGALSRDEIKERIAAFDIPYQILSTSYTKNTNPNAPEQPVHAVFFAQRPDPEIPAAVDVKGDVKEGTQEGDEAAAASKKMLEDFPLPPRAVQRVSRRASIMEAIQSRPFRTANKRRSFDTYYDWNAAAAAYGDPYSDRGGAGLPRETTAAPPYEPPSSRARRSEPAYARARRSERRSRENRPDRYTRTGPVRPRRDVDSMYKTSPSSSERERTSSTRRGESRGSPGSGRY